VKGGENHRDTLGVLPWVMGSDAQGFSDAMNAARKRRNQGLYDATGFADEDDVAALLKRVSGFETLLDRWMVETHPELLG